MDHGQRSVSYIEQRLGYGSGASRCSGLRAVRLRCRCHPVGCSAWSDRLRRRARCTSCRNKGARPGCAAGRGRRREYFSYLAFFSASDPAMLLRVPNSRERALTDQTTLDVTGYARLLRLTWWTQHVAWPLAVFGAGSDPPCLRVAGSRPTSTGWENSSPTDFLQPSPLRPSGSPAADRRRAVQARGRRRRTTCRGRPWRPPSFPACRSLRLRTVSLAAPVMSLPALIVTAAVALRGIDYAVKLARTGRCRLFARTTRRCANAL